MALSSSFLQNRSQILDGKVNNTPISTGNSSFEAQRKRILDNPVVTPTAKPYQASQIKQVQAPPQGFKIGDVISNIGKTIQKAITPLKTEPVKLSSGLKLTLTPSKLTPDFSDSKQTTSAKTTVTKQSVAKQQKGADKIEKAGQALVNTFPGVTKTFNELNLDPFSLKENPKKAISTYINTVEGSIDSAARSLRKIFTNDTKTPPKAIERVGAELETVARTAGAVFSPISALFTASEKIPVLGSFAKLFNSSFVALGEGTTALSNAFVDRLPVSKEVKNAIKPGLAEIVSLAAQIKLGKTLEPGKRGELIDKYGVKDAMIIETKAKELAQAEKNTLKTGENTPEQVTSYVMNNKLENTPDGKALLKSAVEAQKQGTTINIEDNPINSYLSEAKNPEELKTQNYVRSNFDQFKKDYTARIQKEFGTDNVISADEAKYVIPDYSGEKAANYHEASSAGVKVLYDEMLQENKGTKNNTTLFTAGATGVGKTTALREAGLDLKDYSIVYDTNLTGKGAIDRVQKALDNGYKVDITFTQRDPVVAFEKGVIPRVRSRNRIVTIEEHINRYEQALSSIKEIQKKFGDKVNVEFIDNTGASPSDAKLVSIDNLPTFKYNRAELKDILHEKLSQALNEGKVTQKEANAIAETDFRPNVSKSTPEKQIELVKEIKTSRDLPVDSLGKEKVSRLEQRVLESVKNIPDDIKEKLGTSVFNEVSKKENISKAIDYINKNPDDAIKILTGEIEAPKGILRNAIYVALEKMGSEDAPLARKLASLTSTRLGQEISILSEIDPNSPVKLMKDIIKVRQESILKRLGKPVTEAIKGEADRIKRTIKTPNKSDWNSFISGLQC